MELYLDESGNLGKKGRYFVIACFCPRSPKRIKNIIKRSCIRFGQDGQPLKELKGSLLDFPQKQEVINKFKKVDDFSCSYLVAEKKHIQEKLLIDNNLAYNYLCSHLLKPIIRLANEDIDIVVDNHTIKVQSLNSLSDYIKLKAYGEWEFKQNINFEYQDSINCRNLQAVDLVSNIVYGKYEYNTKHLYKIIGSSFKHRIKFPYQKFNQAVVDNANRIK